VYTSLLKVIFDLYGCCGMLVLALFQCSLWDHRNSLVTFISLNCYFGCRTNQISGCHYLTSIKQSCRNNTKIVAPTSRKAVFSTAGKIITCNDTAYMRKLSCCDITSGYSLNSRIRLPGHFYSRKQTRNKVRLLLVTSNIIICTFAFAHSHLWQVIHV